MKRKFKDPIPFDVYVTLRLMALAAGALAFLAPMFVQSPHERAEAYEPLIVSDVGERGA